MVVCCITGRHLNTFCTQGFKLFIDPENIDDIKVTYRLKSGQMATHHTMLPHSSTTNRSERWRRVIVLRYIAADAQIGEKTYVCPITREPFDREAFLVRGRDLNDQGRRQTPF